eukprot:TRINITY_DN2550_c0_g1_i2.p2 TRINITY_DN2550_c0_g1~~TRINITY_DN2550_c0_g1_i2.p2  ORF type:complete len:366 (-),score=97.62 TRINITY_DN2550_c0_g1_i2:20-1117(-)
MLLSIKVLSLKTFIQLTFYTNCVCFAFCLRFIGCTVLFIYFISRIIRQSSSVPQESSRIFRNSPTTPPPQSSSPAPTGTPPPESSKAKMERAGSVRLPKVAGGGGSEHGSNMSAAIDITVNPNIANSSLANNGRPNSPSALHGASAPDERQLPYPRAVTPPMNATNAAIRKRALHGSISPPVGGSTSLMTAGGGEAEAGANCNVAGPIASPLMDTGPARKNWASIFQNNKPQTQLLGFHSLLPLPQIMNELARCFHSLNITTVEETLKNNNNNSNDSSGVQQQQQQQGQGQGQGQVQQQGHGSASVSLLARYSTLEGTSSVTFVVEVIPLQLRGTLTHYIDMHYVRGEAQFYQDIGIVLKQNLKL